MDIVNRQPFMPTPRQTGEEKTKNGEEKRRRKEPVLVNTCIMVAMQISMVAIDNYNYQKKPQLPILTEPLLVDCCWTIYWIHQIRVNQWITTKC